MQITRAIADDLARSIASHLEQIETKFNTVGSRISSVVKIYLAASAEFLDATVLLAIASSPTLHS